jgi:endonuclease YncB( thermonuclease family)
MNRALLLPVSVMLTIVVAFISAVTYGATKNGVEIVGPARVVDGDTLEIDGTKIRLVGMDAPEGGQLCRDDMALSYRCGDAAGEALGRLTASQRVVCRGQGTDRYRRTLATCATPRTLDIGLEMIRLGWATVYDGAPPPVGYKKAEEDAQRRRVGMWRGSFERPSSWRRNNRLGHSNR